MLITIYFEKIQINVETIYSRFCGFGKIQKIIIFRKKNFQIFIELETADEASKFKNSLTNFNFEKSFNLKIQFTQKKELVVNNNTMMEFDFTKKDIQSYSQATKRSLLTGSHQILTPEPMNSMMYYHNNSHFKSRFMTPTVQNSELMARDIQPNSACLKLKMGQRGDNFLGVRQTDRSYLEMLGGIQTFPYSGLDFQSNGKAGRVPNSERKQFVFPRMESLDGLRFYSTKSSFNEIGPKEETYKSAKQGSSDNNKRKTLSLKEKYKLKIQAKKRLRKKQKEKLLMSKQSETLMSQESDCTLKEQMVAGSNRSHVKSFFDLEDTEKKERENGHLSDGISHMEKESTVKKKSIIINPNIIVNNFSFKGESGGFNLKNSQEGKKLFPEKIQEQIKEEDSNFSLAQLKENLSRESLKEESMNIFRVFDKEGSGHDSFNQAPLETDKDPLPKNLDSLFGLNQNRSIESVSKDSFKEFDFQACPEEESFDMEGIVTANLNSLKSTYQDKQSSELFLSQNKPKSLVPQMEPTIFDPEKIDNFPTSSRIEDFLTFHSKLIYI